MQSPSEGCSLPEEKQRPGPAFLQGPFDLLQGEISSAASLGPGWATERRGPCEYICITTTVFLPSFPEFTKHSFTTLDLASRRARGKQAGVGLSQGEDSVEDGAHTSLNHWAERKRVPGHWDARDEGPFSWCRL